MHVGPSRVGLACTCTVQPYDRPSSHPSGCALVHVARTEWPQRRSTLHACMHACVHAQMHARQHISGSARLARERLECVMGDRDNDGAVGAARRMDTNGRMDTNANGYERGETGERTERATGGRRGRAGERAERAKGRANGRTGAENRPESGVPVPAARGGPLSCHIPRVRLAKLRGDDPEARGRVDAKEAGRGRGAQGGPVQPAGGPGEGAEPAGAAGRPAAGGLPRQNLTRRKGYYDL